MMQRRAANVIQLSAFANKGLRSDTSHLEKVFLAAEPALEVLINYHRFLLQQRLRQITRLFHQPLIGLQISKTQQCLARLPGAEEFAGAANFQVAPSDLETVGRFAHGHQSLFGSAAQWTLV